MNFEQSTQARYWMFDETSLHQCQREACEIQSTVSSDGNSRPTAVKVRKHASGYSVTGERKFEQIASQQRSSQRALSLSHEDQETLVHFHAHQIQRLVGPNAILPELRRSVSALSTAIMIFRRFYLSNSVIDFHPRNMAAASALLAVKVDCEKDLEITLLSHATVIINRKAQNALLCSSELRALSVEEIEEAERSLLEGLDFRLRCHHPYGAIKVLASDIVHHLTERAGYNSPDSQYCGYQSPRSVIYGASPARRLGSVCDRAIAVSQAALVYSDVCFLFPPGQIAFAAVAIALEGRVGRTMHEYLKVRFPQKTPGEREHFEDEVARIVALIADSPSIDMSRYSSPVLRKSRRTTQNQAAAIRRAFSLAADIRASLEPPRSDKNNVFRCTHSTRKRKDCFRREEDSSMSLYLERRFKVARVTPSRTLFYDNH